jgi:hypothetical protein
MVLALGALWTVALPDWASILSMYNVILTDDGQGSPAILVNAANQTK